jgi:hypothetical protein
MNRALALFAYVALVAGPALAQSAPRSIGPDSDTGKVYGVWKRAPHSKGSHTLDNLIIKNVSKTCRDDCLEIEDGSGPVTVKGGTWRHVGSPEKISAAFTNQNGSLILDGVTIVGSYDPKVTVKAEFANTDGVMSAQRTFLTVKNATISNGYDAAIDSKATTTLTGTVTVENNGVGLKIWGPATAETVIAKGNRRGQVSCLRSPVVGCNLFIDTLIVFDTNPNGLVFGFQGSDTTIRVRQCEFHVPSSYRLKWVKEGVKNANLIVGPTCAKDGKIVIAPLKPSAASAVAQIVDVGQLLPDGSNDGLIKLGSKWAARLNLKTNTVVRHLDGFRYQLVR